MKTTHDRAAHEALRQIPYGLYIVGVRGKHDGETNALVVSWATQCSFDPPLVLIALRKDSRSYDLLRQGKVFSLNLLDKQDEALARQLEKPADAVGDKLRQVEHVRDKTGAPLLPQALAYVECEVREVHEPGDHAVVIGEVVNAGVRAEGQPLMCSDLGWKYGG